MMRALWLQNNTLTFRDDIPKPVRGRGETLVRVVLAGICQTDLELTKGYSAFQGIPGHEFVGEVVEADDDTWLGRRIVADINIPCTTCRMCREGLPLHCSERAVLGIRNAHGAFSEYIALPLNNLFAVPESVSNESAVFAEPLAAALNIQDRRLVESGDRVLVVGAGRLGQLIAQTLALTGGCLQVVARHCHQQELLAKRNISWIREEEIPEQTMDVVVEATGTPAGFDIALKAVRPRGVIVLKSTYQGKTPADLSAVVVHEITVVGSRCGPMDKALGLLEQGRIDPVEMITCRYPLEKGPEAFEHAARTGSMKVLLEP